ncbi:hypothetical protein N9060_00195, partial [Arenicella sp.]|nr:hypothetical protein [Arenicella sp.]
RIHATVMYPHPVGKKKARLIFVAPKPPKEDGGGVQLNQCNFMIQLKSLRKPIRKKYFFSDQFG